MATLYELTEEYLTLMTLLEDEEIPEDVIKNTLAGLDWEIENKADTYAKIIRNMEVSIDGMQSEIKRLDNRKTIFENRIKKLKENLKNSMKITGKTKFSTELFSFNVQKNGGLRKLNVTVKVDELPQEFRIPQPDKVDGKALRDYIITNGKNEDDGSIVSKYGIIEPQGDSVRIK